MTKFGDFDFLWSWKILFFGEKFEFVVFVQILVSLGKGSLEMEKTTNSIFSPKTRFSSFINNRNNRILSFLVDFVFLFSRHLYPIATSLTSGIIWSWKASASVTRKTRWRSISYWRQKAFEKLKRHQKIIYSKDIILFVCFACFRFLLWTCRFSMR